MKTVIRLQHMPPSTNNLFVNVRGKGRVKTDRYRTWLQAAGWDMKKYHNHRWNEPVHLTIALGKMRANADISNRIKAIEDLLVTHQIIPGDSAAWVREINIYMAQEPFEGVEVTITPAASPLAREAA
jgi:Holliday junction resolvase RusA-like endonuclease